MNITRNQKNKTIIHSNSQPHIDKPRKNFELITLKYKVFNEIKNEKSFSTNKSTTTITNNNQITTSTQKKDFVYKKKKSRLKFLENNSKNNQKHPKESENNDKNKENSRNDPFKSSLYYLSFSPIKQSFEGNTVNNVNNNYNKMKGVLNRSPGLDKYNNINIINIINNDSQKIEKSGLNNSKNSLLHKDNVLYKKNCIDKSFRFSSQPKNYSNHNTYTTHTTNNIYRTPIIISKNPNKELIESGFGTITIPKVINNDDYIINTKSKPNDSIDNKQNHSQLTENHISHIQILHLSLSVRIFHYEDELFHNNLEKITDSLIFELFNIGNNSLYYENTNIIHLYTHQLYMNFLIFFISIKQILLEFILNNSLLLKIETVLFEMNSLLFEIINIFYINTLIPNNDKSNISIIDSINRIRLYKVKGSKSHNVFNLNNGLSDLRYIKDYFESNFLNIFNYISQFLYDILCEKYYVGIKSFLIQSLFYLNNIGFINHNQDRFQIFIKKTKECIFHSLFLKRLNKIQDFNTQIYSSLSKEVPYQPSNKLYSLVIDIDYMLILFENSPCGGNFLIRPFVFDFLKEVSLLYEIIVFTSASKEYSDRIINIIEHDKKYISFKLYKHHLSVLPNGSIVKVS